MLSKTQRLAYFYLLTIASCITSHGVCNGQSQETQPETEIITTTSLSTPMFAESEYAFGAQEDISGFQERIKPVEFNLDRPTRSQALEILRNMSRFIESQESVRFDIRVRFKEQGVNGFIAGPNLINVAFDQDGRVSIRRQREEQVIRSDGRYLMQVRGDRFTFGQAPGSIEEFLKVAEVRNAGWNDQATVRLLRLFLPTTTKSWLDDWDVAYMGEAEVDGVAAQRVRISGITRRLDENQEWTTWPNDPRRKFQWDLYVAKGSQPVPLYIKPDLSYYVSPKVWGPDRITDSNIVLANWSFDTSEVQREFKHEIPAGVEYVDDIRYTPEIDPFLGKTLPDYLVRSRVDEKKPQLTLRDLVQPKPMVFTFFAEAKLSKEILPEIEKIRDEYSFRGIDFVAVNTRTWFDDDWPKFIKEKNISMPIYHDWASKIGHNSEFNSFPMIMVLDSSGVIQSVNRLGYDWYDPGQPRLPSDKSIERLRSDLEMVIEGEAIGEGTLQRFESDKKRRESKAREIAEIISMN